MKTEEPLQYFAKIKIAEKHGLILEFMTLCGFRLPSNRSHRHMIDINYYNFLCFSVSRESPDRRRNKNRHLVRCSI